jgi:hypothetical protein
MSRLLCHLSYTAVVGNDGHDTPRHDEAGGFTAGLPT